MKRVNIPEKILQLHVIFFRIDIIISKFQKQETLNKTQ